MPKYLVQSSYTVDGIKGVLKDGGTARKAAMQKMVAGLGGRLEAMYFAFGESDVFEILDVPDNVTTFAATLAIIGSGSAHTKTTVLLTPEEVDQAVKKPVAYRPPGAL